LKKYAGKGSKRIHLPRKHNSFSKMDSFELPQELRSAIGSDPVDFAVKSGPHGPFRTFLPSIIFGLAFAGATLLFVFIFLSSENETEEALQRSDTPVIILFSVFFIAGISITFSGIIRALRGGGYFAGTPKQLIYYRKGKLSLIDWMEFTGDIQLSGNGNKCTILLVMRKGQKAGPAKAYVPDLLYITSVSNAFEVERIIRRRIKENDPTPVKR
jgi:hypothetical protein